MVICNFEYIMHIGVCVSWYIININWLCDTKMAASAWCNPLENTGHVIMNRLTYNQCAKCNLIVFRIRDAALIMCPSFNTLSALSIWLLSSYEAFQNPSRLRLNSEFIWKIAFRFGLLVCNGCKESDTFGMPRGADTIIMSPGDVRTQNLKTYMILVSSCSCLCQIH